MKIQIWKDWSVNIGARRSKSCNVGFYGQRNKIIFVQQYTVRACRTILTCCGALWGNGQGIELVVGALGLVRVEAVLDLHKVVVIESVTFLWTLMSVCLVGLLVGQASVSMSLFPEGMKNWYSFCKLHLFYTMFDLPPSRMFWSWNACWSMTSTSSENAVFSIARMYADKKRQNLKFLYIFWLLLYMRSESLYGGKSLEY